MGLTLTNLVRSKEGNKWVIRGTMAFDSSYPTGGETLSADALGLAYMDNVIPESAGGYSIDATVAAGGATAQILVYRGASGTTGATSGGTPAGTNGTSAVTGTAAAQTFTPSSTSGDLNLGTPAFSGTGLTAAGQVMTTTSTHTMTLNQCAGMWLIPATGSTAPMLILSNTAVTGAAAVLTVQGSAATDAGAYKIVRVLTTGANGASASLSATAAAQTFTGSALSTHTHSVATVAGAEVSNGTNLSTLTGVEFQAAGV